MPRLVIAVLIIVNVFSAAAFSPAAAKRSAANDEISNLLKPVREKHNLPALAAAVVTSKGLVGIGAVGVRKAGTDIPITPEDHWHLGSDTKAMTATLIGALVEQGKLSWDTTLEQVFPELAETLKPGLRKVTFLHLLSHRAGLPANIDWRKASSSGSLREQRLGVLKATASMDLLSDPGTKFGYSNLGYVIAGAMVEKSTNEGWEELITKLVFKPLGMKNVGFGGTGTTGKVDQPWPHGANGKPVSSNGPAVDNPPVLAPAGTVHSSLSDWAKFITDQLRGARGERGLLRPDTYRKLHTPPFGGEYALGWGVAQREWGLGTVLTHAGSNTMNFAVAWVAPKRDLAFLVCTNQGGDVAAKACDEAASALIAFYIKK